MSFLPPLIDGRRFAVSPYTVRVYDDGRRRRRRKSFDSKGLRQFFKANGVPKYFYLFIYFPNVWYDNLPIYIVGKSIANKGKSWKIY
tara:strand:- start:316 stop:576 length:261 start_codon:yes stop_codon:yes gene_type:complete